MDTFTRQKTTDIAQRSLIHPFEVEEPPLDGVSYRAKTPRSKWRTTISFGALAALLVLCANVAILVWTTRTHRANHNGATTLFTGSCERTRQITLWADLAINILSTILLSASNTCAQLLCAPTRSDIEAAHAATKYVDVGIQSMRNLWYVSRRRHAMWWLVACSSIPLHLFYNSVVFSTLSANDYQASLVTESFESGGWWNESRVAGLNYPSSIYTGESTNVNLGQLHAIQQEAVVKNLTKLDNAACLRAYAQNMFESDWRNVLLVTNITLNDTYITSFEHHPSKDADLMWACNATASSSSLTPPPCNVAALISKADTWTIRGASRCSSLWTGNCTTFDAPIQYCLAEPFPAQCTVQLATPLLIVVIIFNAVKFICIAMTAYSDAEPITTVGDAIASFLGRPDKLTKGHGALSAKQVWEDENWQDGQSRGNYQHMHSWKTQSRAGFYQPVAFKRQRRRAGRGVGACQYAICIILCIIALITSFSLLGSGISNSYSNDKSITSQGLGQASPFNMVTLSLGQSLIANVLLANLPQLIISFIYVFYNSVLTGILLTLEYCRFASKRQALRVSRPEGKQRGTYWLNVPYYYSLPLMACMAVLHWLTSRSIFLLQVSTYDNNGKEVPDRAINACGYSTLATLLASVVGLFLTIVLVAMSLRKLDPGMPAAGSCSVAIAAACHGGDRDMAKLALQYGVIGRGREERDLRYDYGEWETAGELVGSAGLRVGFSSKEVSPLVDGVIYH
ncbi:hypothetical protein LTS14_002327 [Recurvomyces mirabilis]|uniref:uncharacterized protein n=1 Tax=Recurvomyces mirabilis TaxID=574656 RepID=UPI002DDFBE7E|nr:hypothetical protein LTS14_002327 [Recurvomyces mirabilis]